MLSDQPAADIPGPRTSSTASRFTPRAARAAAGATFKWSRENASVQTAVTAIAAASNSLGAPSSALTVQSLGRDQVLGFAAGNWIEITDQTHDNNCLPGEIYKIDSVDVATSSIVLTTPLSSNFTSATVAANSYTRIVRWDQSGEVYKVVTGQQQPYYNLDASASSGAPPNGMPRHSQCRPTARSSCWKAASPSRSASPLPTDPCRRWITGVSRRAPPTDRSAS